MSAPREGKNEHGVGKDATGATRDAFRSNDNGQHHPSSLSFLPPGTVAPLSTPAARQQFQMDPYIPSASASSVALAAFTPEELTELQRGFAPRLRPSNGTSGDQTQIMAPSQEQQVRSLLFVAELNPHISQGPRVDFATTFRRVVGPPSSASELSDARDGQSHAEGVTHSPSVHAPAHFRVCSASLQHVEKTIRVGSARLG